MTGLSLSDVGLKWFEDAIETIIEWFHEGLATGYRDLTTTIFNTPTPRSEGAFVFGPPTNEPWTDLYAALVGGEIMLLAFLILLVCVQGRHTIRIFNLGSGYEARKTRKTAWMGAFLIVTWYWIGVLGLYLVDGFTFALLPGIEALSIVMDDFMSIPVSNYGLALVLAVLGGLSMWAIHALFYIREILLFVYFFGMPLGVAVAYGNLPIVSQIARTLCLKFVPLAIMPLPVAILFKGYELVFREGANAPIAPDSPFLSYLVAVSLPVISLLLVWRLFRYASPLTASALKTAGGVTATAGIALGAGYLAGPLAATTAARWGPKAAVGHVAVKQFMGDSSSDPQPESPRRTPQNNVTIDATQHSSYRRTENDPNT